MHEGNRHKVMTTKGEKKMVKYKVAKIGWDNENPFVDVLLISKKQRESVPVDLNSPIFVKKGKKRQIAIVCKQFRELVGEKGVCSINKALAEKLGVKRGNIVEIENGVTESEWARYQAECRHIEVAGVV